MTIYIESDLADRPVGKQTNNPSHIFYTPCTGIWQTVWLEPIPRAHIESLDIAADMHGQGRWLDEDWARHANG